MANINYLIPKILQRECGVSIIKNESLAQLYERAKAKTGVVKLKYDKGGATLCGVTFGTFKTWCRQNNRPTPTENDLKYMTYDTWLSVLKFYFWDSCKADQIESQPVAEIIVDWAWGSGTKTAIKRVQKLIGTYADGIVGKKTLAAINNRDPYLLWKEIRAARYRHIDEICRRDPTQEVWRKGWQNRVANCKY